MPHNRAIAAAVVAVTACSPNHAPDSTTEPTGSGFPYLALAPYPIDFGLVPVGSSGEDDITLLNAGIADLEVDDVSSADASVAVGWTGPESIAPGESIDVALRWTPTTFSDLQTTLQIASNDTVQPLAEIELVGTTPDPDIDVTPTKWDFGSVDVGTTTVVGVSIANTGAAPLDVMSLEYTASDGDLSIDDAALPLVVEPGQSFELRVTYKPTNNGPDAGALTVVSDDPDEPEATAQQTGVAVAVFDAFADFDVASNDDTHLWQYGYSPSPGGDFSFSTYLYDLPAGCWTWGATSIYIPNVSINTTGEDIRIGYPGGIEADWVPAAVWVQMFPGPEETARYSVLRFVVPVSGEWTIDSAFKSVREGTQPTTDAHVVVAGLEVFEADVRGHYDPASDGEAYVDTLALEAGDTVDFVLGPGPNGDYSWDSTVVRATLTLE